LIPWRALSAASSKETGAPEIPNQQQPTGLAVVDSDRNRGKSRSLPSQEMKRRTKNKIRRKIKLEFLGLSKRNTQISLTCFGIPSVISTLLRMQFAHIADGFGAINTPHSQHNLFVKHFHA